MRTNITVSRAWHMACLGMPLASANATWTMQTLGMEAKLPMHRLQVLAQQLEPDTNAAGGFSTRCPVELDSSHSPILSHPNSCSGPSRIRGTAGASAARTAVICGGVVLDVQVLQVPGGVARNITDAASQLLQEPIPAPILISVVGQDAAGSMLLDNLKRLRVDLKCMQQVPGVRTASVCAILDRGGEVACCVADVDGPEQYLSPETVNKQLKSVMSQARLVVVEANLTEGTMLATSIAAKACNVPVLLEPVSVPKARRAVSCLPHLAWITPNGNELISMADELCQRRGWQQLPRPNESSAFNGSAASGSQCGKLPASLSVLLPVASLVLLAGTQRVALTLGEDGAALITLADRLSAGSHPARTSLIHNTDRHCVAAQLHSGNSGALTGPKHHACSGTCWLDVVHLPALPAKVVNLSGAGDTLVGGLVAALLSGADDVQALAVGMAAARATVQCTSNVAQGLDMQTLLKDSQAVLAGACKVRVAVLLPAELQG